MRDPADCDDRRSTSAGAKFGPSTRPPCACESIGKRTAGTLSTGVFAPVCVTGQTGPDLPSMRPSGSNTMRHGALKSTTFVIVNGTFGSSFIVPALICTAADRGIRVRSSAAVKTFHVRRGPRRRQRQDGDTSSNGAVVPAATYVTVGPEFVRIVCPRLTLPCESNTIEPPLTMKSIRPFDVPAAIVEKSISGRPGYLTDAVAVCQPPHAKQPVSIKELTRENRSL
jgi:hypothetical protein